jgi:ABC-2 type transport system ATP-binding protein
MSSISDEIAISIKNVSKTFKLPHEKQSSLKGSFLNAFKKKTYEKQDALKDVSFDVKKGEFFGIVGRNGSGKSTLLKCMAGVYSSGEGSIVVNGTLVPFIELGVGFNPELSGRDNVFLNGALLGFSRDQMLKMYDDIVEFAELEQFMDQKLKNYSSGMQVRLAFSIAIRAKGDILLLDEVLAVGDATFQKKCYNYFNDLKKNKNTVVFVSHDLESVRNFCDKAVLIDKGVVKKMGKTEEVVSEYLKDLQPETGSKEKASTKDDLPIRMSQHASINKDLMDIQDVWVEDERGKKTEVIDKGTKQIFVKFNIIIKKPINVSQIVPGVIIANSKGEFITTSNTSWTSDLEIPNKIKSSKLKYNDIITITFIMPNLYEYDNYKISVNVVSDDLKTFYAWKNEALGVFIERNHRTGGKVYYGYKARIG